MRPLHFTAGLFMLGAQTGIQHQPWQLSTAPTLTIGSLDGELPYQLERVSGAVRLADGSVIVGNAGSSELRYFDSNGKSLKSVGRRGAGPGEFGQFSNIKPFVTGKDRLIVQDANDR